MPVMSPACYAASARTEAAMATEEIRAAVEGAVKAGITGLGETAKQVLADQAPVVVDAQDPLPESNFFWRRLFSFVFMAVLLAFIWFFVDTIGDVARLRSETAIAGLVSIVKWLVVLLGMALMFYMLAPSAEQLARIIQTAKSWRSGVPITGTPPLTNMPSPPAPPAPAAVIPPGPPVPPAPPAPVRPDLTAAAPPVVDLSRE